MKKNLLNQYQKIEEIISFLQENEKLKPSISDIATHMSISTNELQKIILDWSNLSIKQFLQFVSTNYTKEKLSEKKYTLFEAAKKIEKRIADHIQIEVLTKDDISNNKLKIQYEFYTCQFGNVCIASTPKGICSIEFHDNEHTIIEKLTELFPHAILQQKTNNQHVEALAYIKQPYKKQAVITLHILASDFQLLVWKALLNIELGDLTTYGKLAVQLNNPNASRAIGTAIGTNPIAFIIPCHRVIQSTGHNGGYMWNPIRKKAIIAWEAALVDSIN